LKHYVTDGTTRARVSYSRRTLADGRDEVTIYAKDYGQDLAKVLLDGRSIPGMAYRDDTDTMTDYFCRASATIAQECELFEAAAARVPARKDPRHWYAFALSFAVRRRSISSAEPCQGVRRRRAVGEGRWAVGGELARCQSVRMVLQVTGCRRHDPVLPARELGQSLQVIQRLV